MMKAVPFTRATKNLFIDRIDRIKPDSTPQWGSMTPPQTVKHFTTAIQITLGDIQCKDISTFFSRNIIKNVLLYVKKNMPKNVKVPDYMTVSASDSIDEERKNFYAAMDRFIKELEDDPNKKSLHPFFGMLSMREWSLLHGIHLNHHLTQFNV